MTFVPFSYPVPPKNWDQSWANALLRKMEDAALLRYQAMISRLRPGSDISTESRWIDDSAIWTRVIPITRTFLEVDATNISHGITNLGSLVRMTGAWKNGSAWHSIPYKSNASSIDVIVNGTSLVSDIVSPVSWSSFVSGHVIIEFTRA